MYVVKETMNDENIRKAVEEVIELKGYLDESRNNPNISLDEEYVEKRIDHIMSGVRLHNDNLAEQQSE